MTMESEYEDGAEDGIGSLGWAVKLLIMTGSLAAAAAVGVYLHPHLLPVATEQLPQLWRGARNWMTAPVLFLLLNVVVGSLYFSSSFMSKIQPDEERKPRPSKNAAAPEEGAALADRAAAEAEAAEPVAGRAAGLRARLGQSRALARLVRSKSEQIPAASSKADGRWAGRLKKAGTFETSPRPKLKPVVVVADPPEGAPAGHEEVDEKAEAFISRFYHKVKLQRLDSLLRHQQQQQG